VALDRAGQSRSRAVIRHVGTPALTWRMLGGASPHCRTRASPAQFWCDELSTFARAAEGEPDGSLQWPASSVQSTCCGPKGDSSARTTSPVAGGQGLPNVFPAT
jgi:hypothetical protein